MSRISGHATTEGTLRFKNRFVSDLSADHFRNVLDLWFSSIGIGSYLGQPDDAVDSAYEQSLEAAVFSGINVIDSAINYRCQRSERSFGRCLSRLIASGKIARDEIILCTKGGFLPFDGEFPGNPEDYIRKTYIEPGILGKSDIAEGCHAMRPEYLEDQLAKSLNNLNVDCLDIYYLHNPETQLAAVERKLFYERMRLAFDWLEEKVSEGKIRYYGTATWNGYRTSPESKDYLSLEELQVMARQVGGAEHHFKAIQLPVNLGMPEAWIIGSQKFGAGYVAVSQLAARYGLAMIGSASLLQARLAGELPDFFRKKFPMLETSAQCAIQFARSVPGVTTALVGMKSPRHVAENIKAVKYPAVHENELVLMFQGNG